jgi:hypothetical protein
MSVILGLKLLLFKGSTRTISHSLLIDFIKQNMIIFYLELFMLNYKI